MSVRWCRRPWNSMRNFRSGASLRSRGGWHTPKHTPNMGRPGRSSHTFLRKSQSSRTKSRSTFSESWFPTLLGELQIALGRQEPLHEGEGRREEHRAVLPQPAHGRARPPDARSALHASRPPAFCRCDGPGLRRFTPFPGLISVPLRGRPGCLMSTATASLAQACSGHLPSTPRSTARRPVQTMKRL